MLIIFPEQWLALPVQHACRFIVLGQSRQPAAGAAVHRTRSAINNTADCLANFTS